VLVEQLSRLDEHGALFDGVGLLPGPLGLGRDADGTRNVIRAGDDDLTERLAGRLVEDRQRPAAAVGPSAAVELAVPVSIVQ
jgi:hypothetical protein